MSTAEEVKPVENSEQVEKVANSEQVEKVENSEPVPTSSPASAASSAPPSRPTSGHPATPPPANANACGNANSFEQVFRAFAKFGDSKSSGEAITLSNSDKWFKQAKVIDGKKVTTTDTGIYFKQVAKTKKALSASEYNQFLENLAKSKKMELDDIKHKLAACGPPATTKTTATAASAAVARLTDHTKYTGTHKQRFDETGKGRGKAGREEDKKGTGYVSGYKDEGSYKKAH